jgi:hypothetical protein
MLRELIAVYGLPLVFADRLLQYLDWLGEGALAVAVAALACYVGVKWWRRVALLRQLRMQRIDVAQLSALLASNDPPIVVDARRDRHRALIPFVIPQARPFCEASTRVRN